MKTKQFRIRPITNKEYNEIHGIHCTDFCEDLIINEGKIVTLSEFHYDSSIGHHYFHLRSDEDVEWNGNGMWTVGDDGNMLINKVFVEYNPIVLPEDLFEL